MNDYEDWKGATTQPPLSYMQIVGREDWPTGSKSDELMYKLEAELAMRPLMADNDTSATEFELDDDGMIQWIPVDPNPIEKPDLPEVTGTYQYVASVAARQNAIQSKGVGGIVTWLYAPAPIPLSGAAAA